MAQLPFATLDLSDKYIVHNVTLYAHGHTTEPDGINAAVKAIESALQAFDLDDYDLGGGDSVGGYIEITSTRTLLASELEGHLLYCPTDVTLTLPDSSTLPDNARFDLVVGMGKSVPVVQIVPYDGGKAGADNILLPGNHLNDGARIQNSGTVGDCISLRKGPDGWIAVRNVGFTEYTGK